MTNEPYCVVVNNSAFIFNHRDSYSRFVDEMRRRDKTIMTHQSGKPFDSYDEAIAEFDRIQEGDRWADEINRFQLEDREKNMCFNEE